MNYSGKKLSWGLLCVEGTDILDTKELAEYSTDIDSESALV